jgi:predicted NodU family carbamoyl transferase
VKPQAKQPEAYPECYLYLGHSSVAVLRDADGGYEAIEEEKLSRRKGGDYLPLRTLLALRHYRFERIYIVNFLGAVDYAGFLLRYFHGRQSPLAAFLANTELYEVVLSHHTTHYLSALAFYLAHADDAAASGPLHCIVSDGSGSEWESLTIFKTHLRQGEGLAEPLARTQTLRKAYAQQLSCGHLYARIFCNADTGFAVLKDEYKSLGYEARIDEVLTPRHRRRLDRILRRVAHAFVNERSNHVRHQLLADITRFLPQTTPPHEQPTIPSSWAQKLTLQPVAASGPPGAWRLLPLRHHPEAILHEAAEHHFGHGMSVRRLQALTREEIPAPDVIRRWWQGCSREQVRILAGYLANRLLLELYDALLAPLAADNLLVAGGVHYNVKLNEHLLQRIPGQFCAVPLAGDEAHALAAVAWRHGPGVFKQRGLAFIRRDLSTLPTKLPPGVIPVHTETQLRETVASLVAQGGIVNLMRGHGEIGPRALLHTSTLCLPTPANCRAVNHMNGRDRHMPLAPLLRETKLNAFFSADHRRVVGSLAYMVVGLRYLDSVDRQKYRAVMHWDVHSGAYTGRPQVVAEDGFEAELLHAMEMLSGYELFINTSFNIHGKSTVLTVRHALHDLEYQRRQAVTAVAPTLVVLTH